jgi:Ca2+-binding EF-hand superfamily protein
MRWISLSLLTLALVLSASSSRADDSKPDPGHDPRVAHAKADLNDDGQVDRREFHLRMVEVFFHADTDKDGFMKPEELNRATLIEEDFDDADNDDDGKVSLYEFIEFRFHLFEEVDTDSNGRLSVEEVVVVFER